MRRLIWVFTVCLSSSNFQPHHQVVKFTCSYFRARMVGCSVKPIFRINRVNYYVCRALRKHVFGHMRTAKAQISLRIRAVWSGPSLSANRLIRYYRMYERRAKARMILCACAGWSEFAHILQIRRHCFCLTHTIYFHQWMRDYYYQQDEHNLMRASMSDC